MAWREPVGPVSPRKHVRQAAAQRGFQGGQDPERFQDAGQRIDEDGQNEVAFDQGLG